MVKSNLKKERRVVVTGLGVVSSLGIGWEEFWKNIMAGKSGISKIESFDTSQYDQHYGGEVKNFDPAQFMSRRKVAQIGRASQMAIAASKLAIKDAGVKLADLKKERVGVCVGTTEGEAQLIEGMVKGIVDLNKLDPNKLMALFYPASSISINVANFFALKGKNLIFANACAAGNYAVGYAYDLIKCGRAELMLAGGSDALSRIAFTGFSRLYAMAPEKCQPFDTNRQGMMSGEGSGMLLLESLEHAKRRKAKHYAEVLGYGLSCDGHHMTNPLVDGVVSAIKKAIVRSGIQKEDVDYISAHGTGTKENDAAECAAFNAVFNDRLAKIPVSSIKSMLGHTMGAAAALEAIACCLAVKRGEVPPTINLQELDKDCPVDCVPHLGRMHKVGIALNSSQAFGGSNACLFLRNGP